MTEAAGEKRMATVREAATMLGWSEATVRRGCSERGWPHIRNGDHGSIRIPMDWLERVASGEVVLA